MITILKVVFNGRDYEAQVDYRTALNTYRVSSNDNPSNEFLGAANNVVYASLALFGLEISARLHAIAISDGNEKGSRVILETATNVGGYARVLCPKVSAADVVDEKTLQPIEGHPQNVYNQLVEMLKLQAIEYAAGKARRQRELFDIDLAKDLDQAAGQ